ncbi:autotransporter-associated beta strand repeat-containing protein [Dokdonella sp.]|uniref:InlB B-repeat-containing protein n=1 Tax=Dokdonella sp. TaxID=2291710 RepID=UPI001B1D9668|nr:autotransporter-associated beta strand repeat-containing protein [Dokdonella sp.]MBO9663926.1 autotransporter-associated beta strand repeat-containing protein [Dokdonella sp.]
MLDRVVAAPFRLVHCRRAIRLGLSATLALVPMERALAAFAPCDTPASDCEILTDRTYTDPNVYDYTNKNTLDIMSAGGVYPTITQIGGTVVTKGLGLWNGVTWNISGGTINDAGDLIVAIYSSGAITSRMTQTGGTVNVGTDVRFSIYNGNTGIYTLNGGQLNARSVNLVAGSGNSAAAYLYLNGGTLTANEIKRDGDSTGQQTTAELRFNGGTLRAGSTDNPNWINFNNGWDRRYSTTVLAIDAGGAIFDTNGRSMGIQQPLPVAFSLGSPVSPGISGGGVTKRGAGTLTLSAGNAYTGNTVVEAGTLALANVNAAVNSTVVLNGGTLGFGAIANATFGGLGGSQNFALQNAGGAAVALVVGNNGSSTTYSGAMSGPGSLTKIGGGTLTLAGTSSYAGATSVSAGTLRVNGTSGSGALTVAGGATLGGSGRVAGIATAQNGSHLAPGNSPGTLTFSGGLALNAGAVLDLELGTASDLIKVSGGTFSAANGVTINVADSGGFGAGSYTLIDFTGATANAVGAANFALGAKPAGTYLYTLSVQGTKLVLTAALPPPVVTSVNVPTDGLYNAGKTLDFTVHFDKAVTATGTPRLPIALDSGTAYANYFSGSGTRDLVFRYTVAAGHNDADGITLVPTINVAAGTLRDSAGTDADPTLNNLPSTAGIRIDTTAPQATSMRIVGSPPPSSVTITYTVTFSEGVTGVDAPDFNVETIDGNASGQVATVSGSGGTYTVVVYRIGGVGHLFLTLRNGGTGIVDAAGNAIAGGFRLGDSFLANVQRRCHVDQAAVGANDGTTWADAYVDLQSAVRDVGCVETWAAKGVYKPGSAKADSFQLRAGAKLYGGFAGVETDLAERTAVVIAAHPTVLSGDIDGNDAADANGVVLDANQIAGSNSTNVILMNKAGGPGYGEDTVLDGVVITAGDASGSAGGGLRCDASLGQTRCSFTLSNLVFSGNRALTGGGISLSASSGNADPVLSKILFRGNRATQTGGAVSLGATAAGASVSPSFDNVVFSGNYAPNWGGAVSLNVNVATLTPTFDNVTFRGNVSGARRGGAIASQAFGGGTSRPTLRNSILWGDGDAGDPEIALDGSGTAVLERSLVQGGCPGASSCTDLIGGDPQLGALGDHGGAVPSLLPGAGGAAIDAGSCRLLDDLRGVARPQGAGCDVGATEYRQSSLDVHVEGRGSVTAGVPPMPLEGDIVDCADSCSAIYDGETSPTVTLTAMPDALQNFIGWSGDCSGSEAVITVAMTQARTCTATFETMLFTVSPSVDGEHGAIEPSVPFTVAGGDTTRFDLTPDPNYHVAGVDGSCGGTLSGPDDTTYTTEPIVGDCTVVARFAIDQHTIDASVDGGHGAIDPSGALLVDHGAAQQFVLTPEANYHVASVDGSCGGNLVGNTYITETVTQDCSVVAHFAIDQHTVEASVDGGHGAINPSGTLLVDHGAAQQFVLTPEANYHVDHVDGSCGGSLVGDTYVVDAVTQDCSVVAHFAIDQHMLSSSVAGGHGTIAPEGTQLVDHGETRQFVLTPEANYHVAGVDGSCGGSLAGNVYTSAAVTQDCTVVAHFAIDRHTVAPSVAGGHGAISPSEAQTIDHGTTQSFTLTPEANYHVASVDGSCGGSLAGNVYTTAAVTQDCTVVAHFAIDRHTVTPSVAGGHGAISPSEAQTVDHGTTQSFTLTPEANYHVASVDGSCGGNLAGNVYTIAAVTQDCTVVAHFAIDRHTVTPSVAGGHGAISPSEAQTIDHGTTQSFTLTPEANYHVASVDGSCGGSLAGNVYTTGAVTQDCTVIAHFAIDRHTVTPSVAGGHGTISPSEAQTVDHDATPSFTLTPEANYHVASVDGSCGGNLAGNVYTTAAVTQDCTVVAHFAIDRHTVTPSVVGGHGTISPSKPQAVDHGATTALTVTPAPHYHVDTVDGSCGGQLAGQTYTTDAIVADCTVVAHFAIDTHTIGGSVQGLLGSGLVLRLNGSDDTPIASNGSFTLQPALDDLSTYAVTIAQQPTAPAQLCSVTGGSGVLDGSDVTDVVVDCAPAQPHLVVSVSDDRDYARYGRLVNYLVTIANDGDGDAVGIRLRDLQPPQLDGASATWICINGGDGAHCTAQGSGPLQDTEVSIPAGRALAWLVTAPVLPDAPGPRIDYQVEIDGPATANALDSDLLVLLRSGFDVMGSDGAESTGDATCHAATRRTQTLDAATGFAFELAAGSSDRIERIVQAQAPDGIGIRVERLGSAGATRVRLVVSARDEIERASAWVPAETGAPLLLGIAASGSEASVLLEGAARSIELALPSAAGAEFSLTSFDGGCR